ncbi:MAG: phosphonoacetaldehyde reductase [Lachnospiraceae bacterium]|nr:phosphonoacetaldehyde reductase [Lachnospiraceae bacterium]
MNEQKILQAKNNYEQLDELFVEKGVKRVFLVCGSSIQFLNINDYFINLERRMGIEVVRFNEFTPNPLYEQVYSGVEKFISSHSDMIIAVGGGSAMDVAKCIKLFANLDKKVNYLKQEIVPNDVELLAIPTTAGTGSEATRYAVIYYNGEKQSVSDYSCIPQIVLMDPSVLQTLPEYQKKATMMDAFCHAIESFWSVNSTDESRMYSREAIKKILKYKDGYLANDEKANEEMLYAANIAGKAINITQTTAGHAMCYKLTGLYGISHGHAAALCIKSLWPYMLYNTDKCIDARGKGYLNDVFGQMAEAFGCKDCYEAYYKFKSILDDINLSVPVLKEDIAKLSSSVNPVRLKNNPIGLDKDTIMLLYEKILDK